MRKKILIAVGADRRGGINGMLAEIAASRDWVVVCVGKKSSGHDLVRAIHETNGEAVFHQGDGGDRLFIDHVLAKTVAKYGRIDALVVGSAVAPADDTFEKITKESASALYWANVGPAVVATQVLIPQFKRQGGGAIVFVGTANVTLGQYGQPNYAMTKAPLYTLAKQLTVKNAQYGIRVNSITPSTTPNSTETWERRRQKYGDDLAHALAQRRPSRRLPTPAGVAKAILLLLSDDAQEVFANNLNIDGGESVAGGDLADDDWQAEAVAKWRKTYSSEKVVCTMDDLQSPGTWTGIVQTLRALLLSIFT